MAPGPPQPQPPSPGPNRRRTAPLTGPPAPPTRQPSIQPPSPNLQERIRALLPPQLAAFSLAFRSAFQVPDSTPSIAGLIAEQRHRLWIEDFLGRLQSPQLQSQHQQARTA